MLVLDGSVLLSHDFSPCVPLSGDTAFGLHDVAMGTQGLVVVAVKRVKRFA